MNELLGSRSVIHQIKYNRCSTCFCHERNMRPLGDIGILSRLCPQLETIRPDNMICWECRSTIRNVMKFREKVLSAQVLWTRMMKGEQIDLKGISNLATTNISTLSVGESKDDLPTISKEVSSHENSQWKREQINKEEIETQEVKDEPDDYFDDDIFVKKFAEYDESDVKINLDIVNGDKRTVKRSTRRSKFNTKKSSKKFDDREEREENRKIKSTDNSETETPLDNVVIRKENLKEMSVEGRICLIHEDREVCTVETMGEREMQDYREGKRGEGIYLNSELKCESCVRRFVSRCAYVDHMILHDEVSGKVVCTICAQRFNTDQALSEHQATHYKMYKCVKCEYESVPLELMLRHYQRNHLAARRVCRDCDLVFRSDKAYGRHRSQVHKERVVCTACGHYFHDHNTLELHMIRRHKNKIKGLECSICHKNLKGPNCLRLHMERMHEQIKEKQTFCVECNSQFKNAASLRSHYRFSSKHNSRENMKHQCTECGKRFYQSAALRRHREGAHLKLRAYQCHKCDQAFNTKRTLGHHILTRHEGGEPKDKMCDYCGKAFTSKAFLKEHINTHTGARPYICEDCGASFAASGTLFWHRKCVHKVLSRKQRAEAEARLKIEAENDSKKLKGNREM